MGKRQHPRKYIHNVANTVLGQIKLYWSGHQDIDLHQDTDDDDFPLRIWKEHELQIMDIVRRMGPEARGRIAECGIGLIGRGIMPRGVSYWDVNQGRDLDLPYDGREHMVLFCSYVIVAAIVDNLRAGIRKEREEQQRIEEEHRIDEQYEQDMAGFIHSGPSAPRTRPIHNSWRQSRR